MKNGEIDHQGFRVSVVRHVFHVNRAATVSHSRDTDQIRIQRTARGDIDDNRIVGADDTVCQRKRNLGTWRKLCVCHCNGAASLVQRYAGGFVGLLSDRTKRAVGVTQLLRSVNRCAIDGLRIGGANNAAINVLVEERDPDWFCEAHLKTPSIRLIPCRDRGRRGAHFWNYTLGGQPGTQKLRISHQLHPVTPGHETSYPFLTPEK